MTPPSEVIAPHALHVSQLPPYPLGEIAQGVLDARSRGRDIIDLSQFNPTLAPPAVGVDSLVQAVLQPQNHRYSSSMGISKLRESFAHYYQQRHGVTVDSADEVVVTLGTKEGLSHALQAVLHAGDSVLLPCPAYPIHRAAISLAGGSVVGVALNDGAAPDQWPAVLDERSDSFFQRLETSYEAAWPHPKVLLLSFPHNPTAITVTKGFFDRVIAFAQERELLVFHDFAYADLCFESYRAPSIFCVEAAKDCAVEFYSLSKGFSVGGWRVSCCVGNATVVAALKKLKSYVDAGAFQPLQIAAAAMLRRADGIIETTADEYRARRDVLVSGLQALGWSVQAPKATVYLWAHAPEKFAPNGEAACKKLFEQAGVAAFPGIGFDVSASAFVRFSLSESESRIRLALERIAEAV